MIATGSSPNQPAEFPFEAPGVFDSDTILELNTIPKSLTVVGAGADRICDLRRSVSSFLTAQSRSCLRRNSLPMSG